MNGGGAVFLGISSPRTDECIPGILGLDLYESLWVFLLECTSPGETFWGPGGHQGHPKEGQLPVSHEF